MKKNLPFALLLLLAIGIHADAQIIINIAGNDTSGTHGTASYSGEGGPATAATLDQVYGIAADGFGNVYFADYADNCIRRVSAAGIINTIAGNSIAGSIGDGGPATDAELGMPSGVATDAAGNLYIGGDDGRIRRVNTSGIITTVAGGGGSLADGIPATDALLYGINGITVDAYGNVYITQYSIENIRKVNTSGIIITIAGTGSYCSGPCGDGGPATAAQFDEPLALSTDAAGNIYVCDYGSNRIRKINTSGIITTVAGNGTATFGGFGGDGGPATAAETATYSATNDSAGNIYIADALNYRIRKVDISDTITTFAGNGTYCIGSCGDGGPATAASVVAQFLAVDRAGNLYLYERFRIRKIVTNNHPPHFVNGRGQYVIICENSGADSVNSLLAIIDSDRFQTEVWSVITPPAHGIFNAAYRSGSTGGVITPIGLYYMPASGFSGSDSFSVIISDAIATDTTTVYITVSPLPGPITGAPNICTWLTTSLTDAVTGGAWSSSATAIASVSAGVVTGVAVGSASITYTTGAGCMASTIVTVHPLPLMITGTSTVCPGSEVRLSDATSGGAWSSAATSVATVGPTGFVTGAAPGTASIIYTLGTGCMRSTTVTVNTSPATIGGAVNACLGETSLLTDAISGGAWHSGNTAVATVGSASGAIAGVALGTSLISYTITATGCSITAVATVNPLPAAISGTLPAAGLCRGVTDTLTDATGGGAWSSNNTAIATVSAGMGTGAVSGIAPGTAIISYTLPSGCAATRAVTINSYSVPAAISGAATVCQDTTTALAELSTGGVWSSSGTAIATIDTGGRVRGVAPGMAIITYSLAAGCAVEKTVSVIAAPAIFTVTGGGDFCTGTGGVPIGLSGSTVGASYQLFYGITYVGAAVAGTGGPLSFGSQALEEVYTVIASYGVTGCAMTMAGSASVTEEPLPAVYSVTGGGAYCLSGSGVHIGLGLSGTGISYRLYSGGIVMGLPAAGTGGPLDFGLFTAAGTYIAVATSTATGCTDTMLGAAVVSVIPIVVPSVTIATGLGMGDTACAGRLLTTIATPVNGGTGPAYIWSINGTPGPVSGATHSYLPIDGDRVTATLISNAACAAPDSVSSATLTLHVLASGAPAISIAASPADTVCAGAPVRFTPTLSFGGAPPALSWVVNGSIASIAGAYTYTPANGDSIACILGSNYQCRTADSGTSNTITLVVADDATPIVILSAVPGTTITYGQSVTLTATATHSSAPQYQWYINGIPVAGAIGSTFTDSALMDGDSVSCQVIGNTVCDNAGYGWAVFEVNGEGVTTPSGSPEGGVTVFPNPGNGTFTITGTLGTTDEDVSIEITDLPGQVIYKSSTNAPNGKLSTQVSLSSALANGVYILRLKSGEAMHTYRVTVTR